MGTVNGLLAGAGDIAILFHDDVHRPSVQRNAPCTFRKVAVKIDAALLK